MLSFVHLTTYHCQHRLFLMQSYFHHEPCFVCLGVYYLNRSASVLEVCGVLVFNAGMWFRVRGG